MSQHAIAYVHSQNITDETARRVFLAVAERSKGEGDILGLNLWDADIPALAPRAGLTADEFRRQLRSLKQHVRMDVREHSDGLWEIVYGPSYTRPAKPKPAKPDLTRGGPHPFWMPGWDQQSIWGYEEGLGHLYAQLYANQDDPDAEPRIWITPPSYIVRDIDELAAAIAQTLIRYVPVRVPAEVIKSWLTTPPLSAR
ncbi:hypothetical protein ABZZ17_20510 [Streptomyces sp. NPDC006512]|uniref:hypothetical protein n=1 Tax=Streptomyces sp. NPDC006512 TaxID=3154307 RepID=UPI0033AD9504